MKVEIACVIDRSGSMSSIRSDAIGGFNTFLAEQKSVPGEATLTLVLFDHEYIEQFKSIPIKDVSDLTNESYVPRGNTALYDAIGRTVDSVGARLDRMKDKPEKVIVLILTDGEENASQEYTASRVAEMIKHQQDKYGWEFVFIAANQDAFLSGSKLNIKACNTVNFAANSFGTSQAYANMSNMTRGYRT